MEEDSPKNPRQLRIKSDTEAVVLYQAFPNEMAESAVQRQSLLEAEGFSPSRMTWFKTSFTQMMYVSDYGHRDSKRSRILAFRVTYMGLEDILSRAALSYKSDVTISGLVDTKAKVHVIWDVARTPLGNKGQNKKSMHIGVSGDALRQLLSHEVLSIEDVTEQAYELKKKIDRRDQAGAEEFVDGLNEEYLPLDNEEIEWRLGML